MMDETELEKQLREMEVPPASEEAKERTREQAWWRLRKRQRKFSLPHPAMSAVLTLLLIAGAMFSGLSYTVTQSTRSGGGDAGRETNRISSAQITQYPAGLRTSLVRMIIGGAEVEKIRFNTPDELNTLDSPHIGVFHPDGGGATYMQAPADLMASGEPGTWRFNAALALPHTGTDASDVVAYLTGVTAKVCANINKEMGIPGIPQLRSDQSGYYTKRMVDDGVTDYVFPPGTQPELDQPELSGQPFGCFQSHDGKNYVYYHVLIER